MDFLKVLFPFRLNLNSEAWSSAKKIEFREQSLSLHSSLDENFGVLLKKPENSCASPFFRNIFGLFLVKSLRKLGFRNKDWLEFSKIPQILCLEFIEKTTTNRPDPWSLVIVIKRIRDEIFFLQENRF